MTRDKSFQAKHITDGEFAHVLVDTATRTTYAPDVHSIVDQTGWPTKLVLAKLDSLKRRDLIQVHCLCGCTSPVHLVVVEQVRDTDMTRRRVVGWGDEQGMAAAVARCEATGR